MAQAEALDDHKPHRERKKARLESRREREFYRYYEPIAHLTEKGPPLCNLHDADSVKAHRPLSSPDRALTAFCQLGALRLGCRRAMLFFFDRNYAYVLAEATRTLSLQDDSVHEAEDSLWLGHTVIPRGYTICEETVCKLPSGDPYDPDPISHIINDLDEDTQFCGRPYVTDGPKAKFYAGVPITTDKGVNIGAYCCLDDHKRDGLDVKEIDFLNDMSKTVMTHLEMVRAKAEQERSTRMVRGLGAFVEGAASMQSWQKEIERRDYRKVGGKIASPAKRPATRPVIPATPTNGLYSVTVHSSPSTSSSSTATTGISPADTDPTSPSGGGVSRTPQVSRRTTENKDLSELLVPPNIQKVFQRAGDLLREAVGVDGVAFLDGSPSTYGGLVDTYDGSDQSSDQSPGAAEHTGTESDGRKSRAGRRIEKACKVLASSHSPVDIFDSKGELQHNIQATTITERFLRSLLRRNPHGKIWNFSEEGDASSDESASDSPPSLDGSEVLKVSNTNNNVDDSNARRAAKRRDRVDDGKEIRRLFPGVRSLALTGMWDQNRGRWFSACAVWTYSPMRMFSQDSEVNYMSAFCDVVMAEVYRLEAQNSDRAKGDFISSISHELRSPLHGILGSVECLQELAFADSFHTDLVSQIEVCGRTLLDIVEHLLDYKKLNNAIKARVSSTDPKCAIRTRPSLAESRKSSMGGLMSLESQVWLDEITEEVVESAVYSHCCSKTKEYILNRRVTVVLDVERSASINWQCRIALGAWKRICINLISNSMKYTTEGFIHISLKSEPIPGKEQKRFNVIFTVQDSGRGMSRDFLENHLFGAFAQEDHLVEGTGLGMSLVAKIVRAMNGKVEVQSEKGHGTTMTVTVPVSVGRPAKSKKDTGDTVKQLRGSSMGILGFGDYQEEARNSHRARHVVARTKLLKSIHKSCEHLGVVVTEETEGNTLDPDVYLIAEPDLISYAQSKQSGPHGAAGSGLEKPLIVVCNSAISVRSLRAASAATGYTTGRVEYIAQPIGEERLRKTIEKCLPEAADRRVSYTAAGDHGSTDAAVETLDRPRTPKRSQHVSVRVRSPGMSSASDGPEAPHNPASKISRTRLVNKEDEDSSANGKVYTPPDDYLSSRSKSAGDNPISPRAVDPITPKSSPLRPTTKPIPTPSGLSLLLVDDNQINLQLLVTYATKQGHRRTTATDGQQAVDAYKAACVASGVIVKAKDLDAAKHSIDTSAKPVLEKPHVILMDISMPVLNGFEATRLIRAFEAQNGLQPAYIVALTGLGSASAQHEAFSSGVDLFLTKPVRLKELTKVLDEIKSKRKDVTRSDTLVTK